MSLSNLYFSPEAQQVPVLPRCLWWEQRSQLTHSSWPSHPHSTCPLVPALLTKSMLSLSLSAHGRKTLFLIWTFQHLIKLLLESFMQSEIVNSLKYCGRSALNSSFLYYLYLILAQWTVSHVCIKCDQQLCLDYLVSLFAQVIEHIANCSFTWLCW